MGLDRDADLLTMQDSLALAVGSQCGPLLIRGCTATLSPSCSRSSPDGAARRKILYLHDAAVLDDLRVPPGSRLEALKGRLNGFHSIRVNDQWRVVFRWEHGSAFDVAVVDYH
jgi:proteic killer suppression protein